MYRIKQIPEDFVVEELYSPCQGSGRYSYFLLTKRDYTTESAINEISRICGIPRKRFSYAGTKDRQAVTTQLCSVLGSIRDIDADGIKVSCIGRGDSPVSLGQLQGNRFRIVVRNILKPPRKISFIINYFDEQRFSAQNFEVGMLLLKKDYAKAAGIIRQKGVSSHLAEYPTDYVGALRRVPLKILMFYISSVQSYLWNAAVGNLISRHYPCTAIQYSLGKLYFPEKRPENSCIPLLAFDTELEGEIEEIYSELLNRNGLSLRDFVIREIPYLTPNGSSRDIVADVEDLSISALTDDELNYGMKKVVACFTLGKGSYATILIQRMFEGL